MSLQKLYAGTTQQFKAERDKAQKRFVQPNAAEAKKHPKLKIEDIKFNRVLFQPRSFTLQDTDPEHVKVIAEGIALNGETEPVSVVKIGKDWICHDGHHRLAAYEKRKWSKPITCRWFQGALEEAIDESLKRNTTAKLAVTRADRYEAAWRRVLLEQGSKKDICDLCEVSDGTVANMRRLVKRVEAAEPELMKHLKWTSGGRIYNREGLLSLRWDIARRLANGMWLTEADIDDKAATLALTLNNKLTDLLTRSVEVTALALKRYNKDLPAKLIQQWTGRKLDTIEAEMKAHAQARREDERVAEERRRETDRALQEARKSGKVIDL